MTSEKTKSKNTGVIVGAVAAVAVASAAFAGAGGAVQLPGFSHGAPLHLTRISTAPIFAPPPGAPLSFADIFEKVSPAVVSIEVTSKVDVSALQGLGGGNNPFGFPFMGPNGPGGKGQGQGGKGAPKGKQAQPDGGDDDDDGPEAQASGSGFFISADGYIVTNNHVVENAKEIKVVLKDKREFKGTVVGTDENTDLAVVKVEGRGFPFVNFENSATPRVGDWVIAIGNPFGLSATATAGIVSAYNRNLNDESSSFVDYLQIDAPINPGNSGGPTFDVFGRVIGVNSAIYSPSARGGSVGIGFAIPADVADSISKQLISGGKVTRGYLGASIAPFTKELAEGIGVDADKDSGAFVQSVTKGGPAEKAGVKIGDVILAVNGVKVADATALTRAVASTHSGDTLKLEILREGKPITLTAKSGTRPTPKELLASTDGDDADAGPGHKGDNTDNNKPTVLGLSVSPLDAATRRHIQAPPEVSGLVVQEVSPGSEGAKKGLQAGDIITMARGVPVNTPADLLAAVDAQKKSNRTSVMLMVMRDGKVVPLLLDLKKDGGKENGKG
jgi:serine protease Do